MPRRLLPLRIVDAPCVLLTAALLLVGTAGCGPELSDEELGRVVSGTPPIPEGYEPYELPDLTASPGEPSAGPANPDQQPAVVAEQRGDSAEEAAQPLDLPGAPPSPPSEPAPAEATTAPAAA